MKFLNTKQAWKWAFKGLAYLLFMYVLILIVLGPLSAALQRAIPWPILSVLINVCLLVVILVGGWFILFRHRCVPVMCGLCHHKLTGRRAGPCPNCGAPAVVAMSSMPKRCMKCGYNLMANPTGRCPECGTPAGHPGFPQESAKPGKPFDRVSPS